MVESQVEVQPPWQGWTHPLHSKPLAREAGVIPSGFGFCGSKEAQQMVMSTDC